MKHFLSYDKQTGIIESKIQGTLATEEIKETSLVVLNMIKETGSTLVLVDYREATVQASVIDVYELPKHFAEIARTAGLHIRAVKRAIVITQRQAELRFFEDVSVNQGQQALLFTDYGEAKKWLLGTGKAP